MNLIVFDFEVFRYNVLLGAILIEENKTSVIQTWNKEEIMNFYNNNKNSIWIGQNISHYDNYIIQSVVSNKEVFKTSQNIIKENKTPYLNIKLNYFDLMDFRFCSLKHIEASYGKKISESEIDFEIDRPLTEEEKLKVESYNLDDLDQTYDCFVEIFDEFRLRLELMKEFNLNLNVLHITENQIGEMVLQAEQLKNADKLYLPPIIYPNLKVKNEIAKNFYLEEKFRKKGVHDTITICNLEHNIGAGGIHGAIKKCYYKEAYYLDVSGYYNLVMINYDLLPRCLTEENKKRYIDLYHYQLELKKINPIKRGAVKIILLAVFGGMGNSYSKFYDPYKCSLVTIVGQMFLIDLLEKLEGKIELIQSNTDGIMINPLPSSSIEEVKEIVDEWQQRTKFNLKFDKIYNLYQRDVNNYVFSNEDKTKLHCKGEIVTHYNNWKKPYLTGAYSSLLPLIICHCIVDFLIYGITPEETIEKNKNNLILFQFICRKVSFNYVEYLIINNETNNITSKKVQNVNRAFPKKKDKYTCSLVKVKESNGKIKKQKFQNLPDDIILYNEEISSEKAIKYLHSKIDFNYYIEKSYERIKEFIDLPIIKDIKDE